MKRLFLFAAGAAMAFAQTIPGRYIVEMDSEPAVAVAIAAKVRLEEARAAVDARRAQIRAEHVPVEAVIRALGGTVRSHYDTVFNGMAVEIPDAAAAQLSGLPGVKGVEPEKLWHPVLDHGVRVHRITDAWASLPGGATNAGAGMKIAIFDGGIDVNHPGFQGFTKALPSGFPIVSSDSEKGNTNNKIIVSRDYTNTGGLDTQGHGTGVAMIAAGLTNTAALDYLLSDNKTITIPLSPITGAAPGAWLGNYKVCGANGCATSNFFQALQDAVNDGMNVINYSVGGPVLSSSQESGQEARAIRNTVAAGVPVVIAAGDDGASPSGQAPSTIDDPAIAPDALSVGAIGNSRIFWYAVSVEGMPPFFAYPPDPSMDSNMPNLTDPVKGRLTDITEFDGNGFGCSALPAGSLNGQIALIQRSPVGSAGACRFDTKLDNAAAAGAVAAVIYNSVPDGIVIMQLMDASLPAVFVTQTDGQTLKAWILHQRSHKPRSPAFGNLTASVDFSGFTPFTISPDVIAAYSPAGPTPGANIKPELVAVGGFDAGSGDEVLTADATANNPTHPYTIEAGTSFSAPFVTGSLAVLMGARPGLTAAQYKSLIVNSTPQFANAADGTKGTPMLVGTGKLDLLGALQNNLTVSPLSVNFQTAAGTVSNTQPLTVTNVGSAADAFTVTVNSLDGTVAPAVDVANFTLSPGASQTIRVTMAGSNLPTGVYDGYLVLSGTRTSIVTRVAYWFGVPGSSVQGISVLNQNNLNSGGSPSSTVSIFIRCTDQIGMPVNTPAPTVVAKTPGGRVSKVYAQGDIPGTYGIDVVLGRARQTLYEFDITAGGTMVPVGIPVF